MIRYMIPLVSSYFDSGMFQYWFVPVLVLAFIATIPGIFRSITRMR